MTPKEKAKELFEKMYNEIQPDELGKDQASAQECTLIAVNEMINYLELNGFSTQIEYWIKVKQEIEKL